MYKAILGTCVVLNIIVTTTRSRKLEHVSAVGELKQRQKVPPTVRILPLPTDALADARQIDCSLTRERTSYACTGQHGGRPNPVS